MKKLLTISILAVMLILATVTGVNATTNDNLADTLYNMAAPYGAKESDKVKIERYLADYPVTEDEANAIVAKAEEAVAILEAAGVTNYKDLSKADKDRIRQIANEAASIIDVTLVFKTGGVDIYKDGKLIEGVSYANNGKLAYTGNNNTVLVVSSIAVIALIAAVVARKKLANA